MYIDICQCNGAGDFAKECGFFLIRFDECEGDVGSPEFDGESGEAGAGAQVGDASRTFHRRVRRGRRGIIFCLVFMAGVREEVTSGEEGFSEVAGDDFFGIADGGEVNAGIPVEEYIDVRRYMFELSGRQNSRFLTGPSARFGMTRALNRGEEGLEQFGDAGGVHGEVRL